MSKELLLYAAMALSACSEPAGIAQSQTGKVDAEKPEPTNDEWTKPYSPKPDEIVYCGTRFTIAIPKGDKFVRDPNTAEDFDLYHWMKKDGGATFYVGNFPQDADLYIPVSDTDGWPAVIAVHGSKDDAKTLRLSEESPKNCVEAELLKAD